MAFSTLLFYRSFLSAFLDALTVTAVLIGVTVGFYRIYHLIISNKYFDDTAHDIHNDASIDSLKVEELDDFKGFLRQLIMQVPSVLLLEVYAQLLVSLKIY